MAKMHVKLTVNGREVETLAEPRTLLILTLVAIALLVAAVISYRQRTAGRVVEAPDSLWPELTDQINDVTSLTVVKAADTIELAGGGSFPLAQGFSARLEGWAGGGPTWWYSGGATAGIERSW